MSPRTEAATTTTQPPDQDPAPEPDDGTPSSHRATDFFSELKRRKVYRVGAAYLAIAFAVLEGADLVFPTLGVAPVVYNGLVLVSLLCFPLALFLAWTFDVTPGGAVRRTDEPGTDAGADSTTVVYVPDPWARLKAALVGAGFVVVLVVGMRMWKGPEANDETAPAISRDVSRSIAVLPFDNISGQAEDLQFVDGVHVDIVTRLYGVRGITPISRASVMDYRDAPKSPGEVAGELSVAMVLEGSLQRTGSRIRFNVQLTDGTGRVVWAEEYDRELTADNLFAIQSDIAQKVTRALGAELSPAELRRVDRVPTENLEAYEFWVRGYHQFNGEFNDEAAIRLLETAVELDPEFASAYSTLGAAYTSAFWNSSQVEFEYCERADEAISRARELDPELPEVHVDAAWYYYRCFLDYDRALASLEEALRLSPNNVEALEVMGVVLRREGRIAESIDAHLRAVELSPLYGDLHWHLKSSYSLLRRGDEARHHAERAISLVPSNDYYYTDAAWVYLRAAGETEPVRELLRRARAAGIEGLPVTSWDVWLAILEGQPDRAIESANAIPRDDILPAFDWYPPYRSRYHLLAAAHRLRGDRQAEQAYLDSARTVLGAAIAETDKAFLRSSLGVVLAELGLPVEAIREGELATRMLPLERDAWGATYMLENLAQIYLITGDHEAALELLEQLMEIPSDLTPAYLARSPIWEPLREHPRFQELVEQGT
ncbi:MAG: tetratricopeptide repeat protein [Gemmatimonadetes bacterium]|nr:tetratricopeptide repeat protein [Gemmatimonadota bacterium]